MVDDDGNPVPTGEVGEICFRGPNLIRGYWNKPEATAEVIDADGWLRSGDLGRLDDEGFIYVEDRAKDMVLRAGENIYCAEVEGAVYEFPGVAEAAVFGVPHERLGEEVALAVVPTAEGDRRGRPVGPPEAAPGRLQGPLHRGGPPRAPAPQRQRQDPQARPPRRHRPPPPTVAPVVAGPPAVRQMSAGRVGRRG